LLSLSLSGNLSPEKSISISANLSLSKPQNPKSLKNPSFSPALMASYDSKFTTGKCSSTATQASTSKRPRMALSPVASALSLLAAVTLASLEGMGFESLSPCQ